MRATLCAAAVFVASGGCTAPSDHIPSTSVVATVAISPSSISTQVGKTMQLTATARDSAGNVVANHAVTWNSSDTAIAQVSVAGMFVAHAPGSAVIHATIGGKEGSASASVTAVPVASVSVSPTAPSVQIGGTIQFTATTRDAAGNTLSGRLTTWSSSNTAVATIDGAGKATAVAAGTTTILATSEGISGQATLTVTTTAPAPVASVTVSLTPATVTAAQTAQATAVLKDAQGNVLTGRSIAWSSSNASVATTSSAGVVSALAAGTSNIIATSEGKTGSATLTVNAPAAGVDTLFVDHFESGALGDAGRWQDIVSNGASIVSAAGEGITAPSGAKILKLTADGAAISHFVSTAATSPYEHLYLSWSMYRSSAYEATNHGLRSGGIRGSTTQWGSYGVGWGTPGSCPSDPANVHQQEFMFAYISDDPSGWAVRTYTNWIGEQMLTTNPPTCGGNFATSPGDNPKATYFDVNFAPPANTWHRYELEVQLNTVGQSDGWQRIWVDGVLKVEHANVKYRTTSGMKLWAITFDTGTLTGSGAYYVDDVVVATKHP